MKVDIQVTMLLVDQGMGTLVELAKEGSEEVVLQTEGERTNWRFRIDPEGDVYVKQVPSVSSVPESRLTPAGTTRAAPTKADEPPTRHGQTILMALPPRDTGATCAREVA